MAVLRNISQSNIVDGVNQFLSLLEMNGSKEYYIVPFTLSTGLKDLVLTLMI